MDIIVRRQLETGDDAQLVTIETMEELTSLLHREGCAEAAWCA